MIKTQLLAESQETSRNETSTNLNINQTEIELQNLDDKYEQEEKEEEEEEFLLKMKNNVEDSQNSSKIDNLFFSRREAKVEFNVCYFIKFLIYHLIYFLWLGPIFGLILIPIEGYNMVRNIGFLGMSFLCFFQSLLFIAGGPDFLASILLIVINPNPDFYIHVGLEEKKFCRFAIVVRCLILALKYAYTTKCQLSRIYLPVIHNYNRESGMSGWMDVDLDTVKLEVEYSFIRQEVNVEMFRINFFSEMSKQWMERFTEDDYYKEKDERVYREMCLMELNNVKYEVMLEEKMKRCSIDMKKYAKMKSFLALVKREKELAKCGLNKTDSTTMSKKESFIQIKILNSKLEEQRATESYKNLIKKIAKQFNATSKSENRVFKYPLPNENLPLYLRTPNVNTLFFDFPGRILFREILYLSKIREGKYFMYFISFCILLQSFIPSISRLINNKPPLGVNFSECYVLLLNTIIYAWVFFSTMNFINIGGIDYKRKLFCMEALSAVITPDKSHLEQVFKIIPSINIFSPSNIKSWMYVRLISMDVGQRYMKKIESYASLMFSIGFILVFLLLLGNFKIIKNFSFHENSVTFLMGYTDASILSIVIFRMMLLGKKLNDYFEIHKSELTCIKVSIKEILSNWEIFLDMTTYVNPYLTKAKEYYALCKEYYRVTSKDKIEEDKFDRKMIPENDEEFKSNLEKVVESIDDAIERIELEANLHPIKLMGFKLTSDFMTDFYIFVIGMLYSLFQYIIDTYVLEKAN